MVEALEALEVRCPPGLFRHEGESMLSRAVPGSALSKQDAW